MEKFKNIVFFSDFVKFLCDAKLKFFRSREKIQKLDILAFFSWKSSKKYLKKNFGKI